MSKDLMRKKMGYVLVIVLVYCLAFAQSAAAAKVIYGSKSPAFSVDMPKNWKFMSDKEGFAQFNNGKGAYFWVQRSEMDKLKPEELLDTYREQGYKVAGSRSEASISGSVGSKFALERSEGGVTWRYEVTEVYRGGIQWVFFNVATKSSFNSFAKEFAAIYGKLKIEGDDDTEKAAVGKTPAAPVQPQLAIKQVKPVSAASQTQAKATNQAPAKGQPQTIEKAQSQVQSSGPVKPEGTTAFVSQLQTEVTSQKPQGYPVQNIAQTSAQPLVQTKGQEAKPAEPLKPSAAIKLAYVKDGHVHVYDMGAEKVIDMGPGRDPQLAYGGGKLLYLGTDGTWYLVNLDTNARTSVTLPDGAEDVRLSPDGDRIAYSTVRQYYFPSTYQQCRSFLADAAGNVLREFKGYALGKADPDKLLINMNAKVGYKSPTFTPDSEKTLLAVQIGYTWNTVLADNRSNTMSLLISGGTGALMSPNGKWIVYSRPMDDNYKQLWLCTGDGSNHRDLGTTTGSYAWSPDSTYVVYENGGSLYRVDIQSGAKVLYMSDAGAPTLSAR